MYVIYQRFYLLFQIFFLIFFSLLFLMYHTFSTNGITDGHSLQFATKLNLALKGGEIEMKHRLVLVWWLHERF